MIHPRQRLSLSLEAGDDRLAVHAQLDDLERHAPPHRLGLFGHIDHPAAALADFLEELVAADRLADGVVGGVGEIELEGGAGGGRRRVQGGGRLLVRGEQGFQAGAQRRIVVAGTVEKGGALGRGLGERETKQVFFRRGVFHVKQTRFQNLSLSVPTRSDTVFAMADLENVLTKAVSVAREFGARRLLLFGSALENPATARDLDLACAGVPGWKLFELAAALEEALQMRLDLVPLDPPTPFTRLIEKRARVLL